MREIPNAWPTDPKQMQRVHDYIYGLAALKNLERPDRLLADNSRASLPGIVVNGLEQGAPRK